jgi:hypothetical protein
LIILYKDTCRAFLVTQQKFIVKNIPVIIIQGGHDHGAKQGSTRMRIDYTYLEEI